MNLQEIVKNPTATIVDVRSHAEFQGGHVAGSFNVPLDQVADRLNEFKSFSQPLVLCCASGNRSGMAASLLLSQGIECVNAGSWMDVNHLINQ